MSTYAAYAERGPASWAGPVAAILVAQVLTLLAFTSPIEVTIGVAIMMALTLAVVVGRSARLFVLLALVPISSNFFAIGFDFAWVREGDRLPLYSWFAVFAATGILVEHVSRIRRYTFSTSVDAAMALIVAWAFVTLLWAPNLPHALLRLFYLVACVVTFYIATTLIRNEANLHRAVNGFIVVGLVVAILSVAYLHIFDTLKLWSYPLADGFSFEYSFKADGQRAKSLNNPNSTSLFLNMSLAFAICSFVWSRGRTSTLRRLFYLGASMLFVVGVLETKSKGGIGSMIIMVVFLLVVSTGLRSRIIANTTLCVTILIGAFLVQTSMIDRTPRILDTTDVSLGDRLSIWELGNDLNMAETRGWGLGIGGFTELGDPIPHAHSVYFSILFDLGPIGIILLLLLVLIVLANAARVLRCQESYAQVMVVAGAGGSVVMAVHGLVDGSYRDPMIWMFLGIFVAAIALAKGEMIERDIAS